MRKALVVMQPFATLIARGEKTEEFRSWSTDYRGALLIVSSARVDVDACEEHGYNPRAMPRSVAVCRVDLVGVRRARGMFAFKLARPKVVEHVPIGVAGFNGHAAASARLHLFSPDVWPSDDARAEALPSPEGEIDTSGPEAGFAVRVGNTLRTMPNSAAALRYACREQREGRTATIVENGIDVHTFAP